MNKWVTEDWGFELTVEEGKARDCRLGIEKGDKFVFSYECPAGICPRVMTELFMKCGALPGVRQKGITLWRREGLAAIPKAIRR